MSATLSTGTLLQGGRYRIERVLGQGGFGITYLATHTGFDQKVALKEFYMKELCVRNEETSHVTLGTGESSATVERFRGKFLKEARNLFRLNHKHIVRVLDIFEENGTAYFAMEYAEGGSLSQKVKAEGALPEAVATRYILQVAEALAYLHEQKMNHLDVKPANIMLSASGDAVLIDFGLAKQYDATGSQTSTTPAGISEGYAPMEQYKLGGVAEFTPETDIYALGATFFKLLTGVTPPSAQDVFEDGVPVETLRQHGVSEAAISVIEQAMKPSKKKRTNNVEAFMAALNSENTVWGTSARDDDETQIITGKVEDDVTFIFKERGHEYVDLGLPSGTLWATCNIGASSPDQPGDFFAWGETEPKIVFNASNYQFKETPLELRIFDDSAHKQWGEGWCMPNSAQFKELMDECVWTWTKVKGAFGYLVKSKRNHNYIFLPAAGRRTDNSLISAQAYGYYWSRSIGTSNSHDAFYLYFNSGNVDWSNCSRRLGLPIRPVRAK